MYEFKDFENLTRQELDDIFSNATKPSFNKLVGFEFKGYNTNILTPLLGIKKFVKVFDITENKEHFGYNLRVKQNKLLEAHLVRKNKKGKPLTQGFYSVKEASNNEEYNNSLIIDYACNWNHKLDVTRSLIDYLVKIYPENDDLYLGKAFLRFGEIKVFVSYFVLKRKEPIEIQIAP